MDRLDNRMGALALGASAIALAATNAALTKPEAARVAALGMDGFTRALSPPHLRSDGDARPRARG